jgi:hypothetical protein
MKALQEMVLIGEIVLQSKIAYRAADRLKATHDNFDNVEVWCSIQSILVAAGNVSKILWPIRKDYKSRGEKLRQLLNVNEDNFLFDRKFRNRFEHYDELIDDWFNTQSSAVYSDLAMNPSLRGSMATNDHRGYNSFNNTLIFRGESLDLSEVLNALEEILNNCRPYVLT